VPAISLQGGTTSASISPFGPGTPLAEQQPGNDPVEQALQPGPRSIQDELALATILLQLHQLDQGAGAGCENQGSSEGPTHVKGQASRSMESTARRTRQGAGASLGQV
jgi:hypothetical protein